MPLPQTFPTFCGKDCGSNACPLLATVEDGRVACMTSNPAGGRYLHGCRRGFELPLTEYAPDRLLTPLIRTGARGSGQYREASWEEALALTVRKLGDIRSAYGAEAVLAMCSAGSTGALHDTESLLARFLAYFGGCTRIDVSYSNGAARFALPYVLGSDWKQSGFDPATMQNAAMIVLWGANILETRLGGAVAPRLLEAHRRGAQVVVIDPRRSETVKRTADWWIPIRPGTDSAMLLSVLYVLFSESLSDRAFIEEHSTGFDQLERYVLGLDGGPPRSPQWAETVCGVPADEISRFARAFAAARPAMLFPGYSIQRVFAGEETYRLTVALQVAAGNFGKLGGSTGSLNNRLPNPRVGSLPVPAAFTAQPAVRGVVWPDAILRGRSGGYPTEIHAVYNLGSNYLNQGGDIRKNVAAFEKLDFTVCHDFFLTPTARYCDVVFPAAAPLEQEDIGIPWLGNYLLYKPQVIPPRGQSRSDYDILCDLAARFGFENEFSEGRSAAQWIQHFLDQSEVPDREAFRHTGIYFAPDQERVGLADFAADPESHPLNTPSGKVEIASRRYYEETGFPPIPTWQQPPADPRYPLQLITPKTLHRTHSQGSNLPAAQDRADHALEIHPQDASARGITDGALVRVFNEHGVTRVKARLSTDLMRGVVCLPEGVWFVLNEDGVDTAGSANLLTDALGTEPAKAPIMHGMGVQVSL